MLYFTSLIISVVLILTCPATRAKIFRVVDFGAYSNDQIDDAKYIQLTIEIINATNLTIEGQGMSETLYHHIQLISIVMFIPCFDMIP